MLDKTLEGCRARSWQIMKLIFLRHRTEFPLSSLFRRVILDVSGRWDDPRAGYQIRRIFIGFTCICVSIYIYTHTLTIHLICIYMLIYRVKGSCHGLRAIRDSRSALVVFSCFPKHDSFRECERRNIRGENKKMTRKKDALKFSSVLLGFFFFTPRGFFYREAHDKSKM